MLARKEQWNWTELHIPQELERTERRFLEYFQNEGYVPHAEEPLIPTKDRSLLFTNAFIVPLKDYITGVRELVDPIVMPQECLRTQNLRTEPSLAAKVNYLMSFRMVGVLVPPAHLQRLVGLIFRYFTEQERIPWSSLRVKASRSHRFFRNHLGDCPQECVQWDQQKPEFYRWRYGEEGVAGEGITFSLKRLNGQYEDIGNLVEIQRNGQVVAYEFGFGLETFLARKYSLRSPLAASKLALASPAWSASCFDQLRDFTYTALQMLSLQIRPSSKGRGFVLRSCISRIHECLGLMNLADGEFLQLSEQLDRVLFPRESFLAQTLMHELGVERERQFRLLCSRRMSPGIMTNQSPAQTQTVKRQMWVTGLARYRLRRREISQALCDTVPRCYGQSPRRIYA